eukprot:1071974_1
MPIPPKKKEEHKPPELVSWQSFVFLGLIATAATGMMISKGGFQMNRNLNVMQRFVTKHADSWDKLVEHKPPSGKNKIFQQNVRDIVETAQKISEDRIADKKEDVRHVYPKPTFPLHRPMKQRPLYSAKRKDEDKDNDE